MEGLDLLKNITLLYVEDDVEVNAALSRSLKRVCKEVYIAHDGQQGYELFQKHQADIDIIVTDIKMPVLDGIGMIKKIRQIDPLKSIIITSAHGESEYLYEAIDEGVASYILKPVNKKRLKETLIYNARAIKQENLERKTIESIERFLELPDSAAMLFKDRQIIKASQKVLDLFGYEDISQLNSFKERILKNLTEGSVTIDEREYKLFGQNINGSMVLIFIQ